MGNKPQGSRVANHEGTTAVLAENPVGEDALWQEKVEVSSCCGVTTKKVHRKRILWEDIFVENCLSLGQEFPWANGMVNLIRKNKLSKEKYFSEVAALKREADVQAPAKTETLGTAAEVVRFKDDLKRAVLLSDSKSKIGRAEQPRIASIIEGPPRRSKIMIQRSSFLNRDSKLNYSHIEKAISSKGSVCKSLLSLIDDTISSVLGGEREISRQTARDIELFLKFSLILQRHLSDPECMLFRIKKAFLGHFSQAYLDSEAASLRAGDFVDDVKQFLVLLRETVCDYYNLGSFAEFVPGNAIIANEENVLSACTAILFKQNAFYTQVMSVACSYCAVRQNKINDILNRLTVKPPSYFHISERFCFSAKTIETYLADSSGPNSEAEKRGLKDFVVENEQPYRSCMEQLKQLQKSRSPMGKMKIIVGCAQGISNEIQRFYERNGLKRDKWVLDADNVLSIFCYVLTGAKVDNLLAHLFVPQNFSTSHQMISASGYYLSVINGAVDHLEAEFDRQEKLSL